MGPPAISPHQPRYACCLPAVAGSCESLQDLPARLDGPKHHMPAHGLVCHALPNLMPSSLALTAALQSQAHCRMSTAPLRCLYGTRLPNTTSPRPRPDGAAPAAAAASLTVAGALNIKRVRQHRAKGVRPLSDAGCAAQASPAQAQHKPPGSHSKLRSDSTSHMCPANGAPAASPQLPPLAPRQSPQPCMPAAAEAGARLAQPRLCHLEWKAPGAGPVPLPACCCRGLGGAQPEACLSRAGP